MLFTSVLVAAASLSGLALAQSNDTTNLPPGIQPCCTVDANIVPTELKDAWCKAQRNTCPEICGGVNELARTGGQDCSVETLEYKCECRNGTVPKMEEYEQSVPGQMCRFWFDRCINATNENLEFQVECRNQRDANCGNRTTNAGAEETAEPSSTPSATSGGDDDEASPTEAVPSSTSSGAAPALAFAREYGTPLLAGGLAAFFGLAL